MSCSYKACPYPEQPSGMCNYHENMLLMSGVQVSDLGKTVTVQAASEKTLADPNQIINSVVERHSSAPKCRSVLALILKKMEPKRVQIATGVSKQTVLKLAGELSDRGLPVSCYCGKRYGHMGRCIATNNSLAI